MQYTTSSRWVVQHDWSPSDERLKYRQSPYNINKRKYLHRNGSQAALFCADCLCKIVPHKCVAGRATPPYIPSKQCAQNRPAVPSRGTPSQVLKSHHARTVLPLLRTGRFGRPAVCRTPNGANPLLDVRSKLAGGSDASGHELVYHGQRTASAREPTFRRCTSRGICQDANRNARPSGREIHHRLSH